MSQNHHTDLRVRRTQKLLREALIGLIAERNFESITVGDIAERAMVSRAAFYRYYQDKYDLVERIFEEMMATVVVEIDPLRYIVINQLNTQLPSESWTNLFGKVAEEHIPPEPYVKIFEHFAQNEKLYRTLLGKRGSSWFVTKMRASLTEIMGKRLQALASTLGNEQIAKNRVFVDGLVPTLLASQLIDAIIWWLEQEKPYTSRQIATYCFRLMCSTLREISVW